MSDRPSAIAGSWYPGNAEMLSRDIERFLDSVRVDPPQGVIRAIVVPHAGYRYSGLTAAYAFSLLRGAAPELVAVLSPLHQAHSAPLLTTGHSAYVTPFGRIEVDRSAVAALNARLVRAAGVGLLPVERDREHSLEIELPFLQHVLGRFRLLPVMLRDQSAETARALGGALAGTLAGSDGLIVASSDLSHFYPEGEATRLDRELLRRLEAFDPEGVLAAEREGAAFACGRGAIAATLWAAKELGANRVTVLHHATSGETSGDLDSVVGYGAAVIWREGEA